MHHPHTLAIPPPPPSLTNALPPTQKKKKLGARTGMASTHAGPNQPSVTNMLMTLHSNESNDFQSQTSVGSSGAAIIAPPPRNIQHQKQQQTKDQ